MGPHPLVVLLRRLKPEQVLAGILALAVLLAAGAAWHWSATYDESNHLEMGRRIVQQWDFSRFDNSKMPVSALNFLGHTAAWGGPDGALFGARLVQLGWLVGTALVVFFWTRSLIGPWPAVGAASLVALDPNLMAHSAVATTDAPCTFFVLLSTWLFWRALNAPSRRGWMGAGTVFGLAQAAKFTSVFLVPILMLIAIGFLLGTRRWGSLRGSGWFLGAALVALNSAYAFQGSFTAGKDIQWQSETFQPLADSAVPLPVPRAWIEGVDWVKADDDRGHGNVYVDGQMTPKGQKDYYLRALLRKFPLPLILLPLVGLWGLRRQGLESLPLLLPPLFLLGWFSLAFNFQLGIRYVLPVVPFLAIWAAHAAPRLVGAGVVWTLLSGLSWWPWGLSYMNETVLDRSQAWRHLADSNLDWGQGERAAQAWLQANPNGQVDPEWPVAGPMLVSGNVLTGVLRDPKYFACVRAGAVVTEVVAGSYFGFELTDEEAASCGPTRKP
ncbi:MAG: glycosyltransferase family 39 protein [Myxococcota bacterium]|nr:glycosyltransferase family 39 protein [Myxococcota bacterium]